MKFIIKCDCGIKHIIKIPFRLRNKIDKVDLICFNCNKEKSFTYLTINKIEEKQNGKEKNR